MKRFTEKIVLVIALLTAVAGPLAAQPAASVGHLPSTWDFLLTALEIFGVNIVLSGDNGVLIAVAVAALPKERRLKAIATGAALIAVCQIAATYFATQLLHLRFVQLIGGLIVFWISLNLFKSSAGSESASTAQQDFWRAIWLIVVAALSMSTDNILTIGAIARGNLPVLAAGLTPSIFVVVFASGFLSFLIGKYPVIVYAGAAILGNVAGQMMMTDAFIQEVFRPSVLIRNSVQVAAAIGMVVTGHLWQQSQATAPASEAVTDGSVPSGGNAGA